MSTDRQITLESEPGEILGYMESNLAGNQNLFSLGAAALSYKGAQLQYEAAEKTARYTKALAWLTAAVVFTGIVNLIIGLILFR